MSLSASEKVEVIRMVEESALSIRKTLEEFGISRSSFYRWYQRYQAGGPDALRSHSRSPRRFWNKLPESVKEQCLETALQHPDKPPGNWPGISQKNITTLSQNPVFTGS